MQSVYSTSFFLSWFRCQQFFRQIRVVESQNHLFHDPSYSDKMKQEISVVMKWGGTSIHTSETAVPNDSKLKIYRIIKANKTKKILWEEVCRENDKTDRPIFVSGSRMRVKISSSIIQNIIYTWRWGHKFLWG